MRCIDMYFDFVSENFYAFAILKLEKKTLKELS